MLRSKTTLFVGCVVACIFLGGTTLLPSGIYSSTAWLSVGIILLVGLLFVMYRFRMWKHPVTFGMHLSIALILTGGIVTATTAVSGTVHLVPHETVADFRTEDNTLLSLPFKLTLDTFYMDYYPGMSMPRDFHSVITADSSCCHISMNKIARINGYRLYQTSFDSKGGSILTVRHDPLGTATTYAGYLIFALSGLLWVVRPRKSTAAICVSLIIFLSPTQSEAAPAIGSELADSIARQQVIFNGRVIPFSTFANEFTRKITGSSAVAGMGAEQFTASIIVFDKQWRQIPFIQIKEKILRDKINLQCKYASVADLYDSTGYKLNAIYRGGNSHLDNAIIRVDEKVALLASLWDGTLFTPLPDYSPLKRSDESVAAEILYNHLQPLKILFIVSFAVALVLFISLFLRNCKWLIWTTVIVTLWSVGQYIWLWYISGNIPLWSASGVLQFLAAGLGCSATVIAIRTKNTMLTALIVFMAGIAALTAWISLSDPVMTPLMPVLASPWLTIHVTLVMAAYVLLGLTLPISLLSLCSRSQTGYLFTLSSAILRPGIYLLALGIITGAMWANVSWGRYWAWDPKETWALVTLLLYAIPLHRSLGVKENIRTYNIYMCFAFLSIVMTYAGVNLLPSLHAYQ